MSAPAAATPAEPRDSSVRHLLSAVIYTVITVIALGIIYPVLIWAIASVVFPHAAGGSLIVVDGKVVGSELVGQNFAKPGYFQGRPSAAGKGYDPTSTGGTNFGATSKKLIDATRTTIAALKKANPDAPGEVPMDLVTSSASGIDPDISPEGAAYQIPRVARARSLPIARVQALVEAHTMPRMLGVFGEPHVNVLELNRALDAQGASR